MTTALEHLGLCAEELCQQAGLDFDTITDRTVHIDEIDLVRLWQRALEVSGDPLLGLHAGEHISPRNNNIMSILAVSGRTLGDGLSAIVKYQGIFVDREVGELRDEGDDTRLYLFLDLDTPVLPHQREFLLAGGQNLINTMTLNSARPKQVRFRHRLRGGLAEYERIFGCDVFFDQADTSILFAADTWNMELQVWDPFLQSRLESLAMEVHARATQRGFISSVSRAIEELLAQGPCDLGATAKRIGVSDRTLQRRLHEEGTQFREVLDATRKSIVERAQNREVGEEELARLTGFGSVRALRRAVDRWAGADET